MPICSHSLRRSNVQDIGTYSSLVVNALCGLGNIYFGSSRPVSEVVFEDIRTFSMVTIDCDEIYYSGVFDPLVYQYYINHSQHLVANDMTFNPPVRRQYPPMDTMKHISEASCCFRVFFAVVDPTPYQNTLLRRNEDYGFEGVWSPCIKCIKPNILEVP